MLIRRKSLCSKGLRQKRGRKFVVSPYTTRIYVESLYTSVRLFTPHIWGDNYPSIPCGHDTPSHGGCHASSG